MIEYIVKFENQLTMAQVQVLTNRAISHFGPCKPSRITVGGGSAISVFDFMEDCITAEELKSAVDKTLESAHETNPVQVIKKNGVQVWPSKN